MDQQASRATSNQVLPAMRFRTLVAALLIGSYFITSAAEAATFTVISNLKSPVSPTLPDYSDSVNVLEAELSIAGSPAATADTILSGKLITELETVGSSIWGMNFSGGNISLSDWEHTLGFLGAIVYEDLAATGSDLGIVAIPASGDFDASNQGFLINSGNISGIGGAIDAFEIDLEIPTNNVLVTGDDVQLARFDQFISGTSVVATITVPIDTTIRLAEDFGGIDLRLRGNLVADPCLLLEQSLCIPEPTNGALLACGLMVGALSRRRRSVRRTRFRCSR